MNTNTSFEWITKILVGACQLGSSSWLWSISAIGFTRRTSPSNQHYFHPPAHIWIHIMHCINVSCMAYTTITPWSLYNISPVGIWSLHRWYHVIIRQCFIFYDGSKGNELFYTASTGQCGNLQCTGVPHDCGILGRFLIQLFYLFLLPCNH